jgi:hypothetical protein
MPFIRDASFDLMLADVNDATRIDICTQEPTTYSQATTEGTYSCGYKTGITVGAPEAGAVDGRRVIVPAVTDGTVACTATVTASHWALTNGSDTLYATGSLTTPTSVVDGAIWTCPAFSVTARDAVSE